MHARIAGIAKAIPDHILSQKDILRDVNALLKPSAASGALYEKFLLDEGIEQRHFGCRDIHELLVESFDERAARYERVAVALSVQALEKLQEQIKLSSADIDAVFIATCTGYLCPGLTSYIAEAAALTAEVYAVDIIGSGCAGAMTALRSAVDYLDQHPGSNAVVIATEVCSAAVHWADHPDLILSNCIFSDGSAACLVSNRQGCAGLSITQYSSLLLPKYRDALRFKYLNASLCNVISSRVPMIAAGAVAAVDTALSPQGRSDHYAFHGGGRRVIDLIQKHLELDDGVMQPTRQVLRDHGNMSSPSVLFALADVLNVGPQEGDTVSAFAFGAGFSILGVTGTWQPAA